jgi:tRNA1Val (adenine37-N6)-methyltransferase
MGNSFFKFKEFVVEQDKCAMKVCTDACLFGAWLADIFSKEKNIEHVLDIGAGTGLLSLMLAQTIDSSIDAIEIDSDAATQCRQNFENSVWKERLNVFNTSIQEFDSAKKYKLIISNPPFFDNDLKSPDNKKNAAMHSTSLSLKELFGAVKVYLPKSGIFAVLLPFHRSDECKKMALDFALEVTHEMLVRQTPQHDFFRVMLLFSTQQKELVQEEIIIESSKGKYSKRFVELLKSYYLKL